MEPDLSDRYNTGLLPPPDQAEAEPPRLQRPAWQPTPIQAQIARKQLFLVLAALLALLACAGLFAALGWIPG